MKNVLAVLLGSVLGLVLGAGAMHQWLMPQLFESNAKLTVAEQKLAALEQETESSGEQVARLEAERNQYSERLASLQSKLDAVVGTAPPAEVALPMEEETDADASAEPAVDEAAVPPAEGERGPGRNRGDRWGGGTPEEREARRQEFATRMQENMANFFTGELEKSNTPEMQERLVALEQKTQEMLDLRSQMRAAETDEEREALGQAFGESMNAAREIMQEQQGDMLGAIANQFGITKEGDQAAFEQAVRSAMESPIFSDNPGALLWNAGGGGGGMGGRSGFGGGGFRGGPGR
jgi:DNA repair exonuclease SbcCD ATPase subunit